VETATVTFITYGDDVGPSWSSDGSQIAFARIDYELETSDLWIVHPDGSGLERLTDTPDREEFTPSWAPDDSRLVYVAGNLDDEGLLDVWVMDRDGTNSSNVTNLPPHAQRSYWGPVWSPGSEEIAVILQSLHYPDIVVMGVDGSSWRNLTEDSSFLSAVDPAWSPDGSRIAHVRQAQNGDSDIWVMDPNGENAIQVSDLEGCESSPAWEPYRGAFPDSEGWVAFFSDVNPETSRSPEITQHRFASDIAWLADREITRGCNPPSNTRFCPDGFVTRGQMAAFLVRALGLSDRLVDPFVDDDGSVFEADIERLAAAGITNGCNPPSNSWFCPDGYVTRGQMAAFLHRALG
jgi:Tol biopolymer transport system component